MAVILKTHTDITGVSANGNSYQVIDGLVEVDEADAAVLIAEFGFTSERAKPVALAPAPAAEPAPAPAESKKKKSTEAPKSEPTE